MIENGPLIFGSGSPESSGGETVAILERIKNAKKFVEKKRKNPQHVSKDDEVVDVGKKQYPVPDKETPPEHQQRLHKAKDNMVAALGKAKERPSWLIQGEDDVQYSPNAAIFVERIALLPPELQNDPFVLYEEVARFSASLPYGMTKEARIETRQIIIKTIDRIMVLRQEHPDTGFPLKQQELLATLTELGMGGVPTPPELYDPNVDLQQQKGEQQTRKNLRAYIAGSQQRMKMFWNQGSGDSMQELRELESIEQDLIHGSAPTVDPKSGKIVAAVFDGTEVDEFLHRIRDRKMVLQDDITALRQQQRKDMDQERGFSTFILSPEIVKALCGDDYEWAVEAAIRKQEALSPLLPNTEGAEAVQQQVRQMVQYFTSEQYLSDVLEGMRKRTKTPGDRFYGKDEAFVQKEFELRKSDIKKLSDKIHHRLTAQIVYGLIKGSGDAKKVSETLTYFGSAGFSVLQSENGGCNAVASMRLYELTREARFDEKGRERPLTPEIMRGVKEKLRLEIKEERDFYEELYKTRWSSDFDDSAIDSIIHQSEILLAISQRDIIARLDGPGPADRIGSSSFLSGSTIEKLLSAFDISKYSNEKWAKLSPFQIKVWRNVCEHAAQASGRDKLVVDKRLLGVQPGTPEFKQLMIEVFGADKNGEPNMGKVKRILEIERKAQGGFKGRKAIPTKWEQMDVSDLRQQMVVKEGEKIVTELLSAYDDFSSGWRITEYLNQLDSMYDYSEHLALGMRLRKKGDDFIRAETKESREVAVKEVKKMLSEEIALYRPQAMFEWLFQEKDLKAQEHFTLMKTNGLLTKDKLGISEDISRVDQLYGFISKRFMRINDVLAFKGLPPIDYSQTTPISSEQMAIIEKVCSVTGRDGYLEVMKDLSGFVHSSETIDTLVQPQFYSIYKRTKWTDDVRMQYLDIPDEAPGSKTKEDFDKTGIRHIRLAERFTDAGNGGEGGGDQFTRAWNDLALALQAADILYASLSPNVEEFGKKMKELFDTVALYAGKEPAAARAVIFMIAGFGKTVKTDTVMNFLMASGWDDSSEAKRMLNGEAPSLSIGELLQFLEKIELQLDSLESLAPELAKEAEVFMGVRWGFMKNASSELGRHAPVWAHRLEIAFLISSLLVLTLAGKEAGEELEGGKK